MSRPAVIVDTNVVVAGLLTGDATSPVARILDGMLAATFPFVVSEALLALVTGDQALQDDAAMRARVLSPRAFVDG